METGMHLFEEGVVLMLIRPCVSLPLAPSLNRAVAQVLLVAFPYLLQPTAQVRVELLRICTGWYTDKCTYVCAY